MNIDEFNYKWRANLESNHYGLAINDEDVITYLDEQFIIETKNNKNFKYQQIKSKWDYICVYSNSDKNQVWEKEITKIIKNS